MIGDNSFCPKSGAPLDPDKHYDEDGRYGRAVSDTEASRAIGSRGELTSGSVRSSKQALLVFFRRTHERHHDENAELYRRCALALRRLLGATSRQPLDVVVWYALERRLAALGYETDWMHAHGELHCPRCHGPLRFYQVAGELTGICGTDCDDRRTDMLAELRESIVELYAATFPDDDQPDTSDVLR